MTAEVSMNGSGHATEGTNQYTDVNVKHVKQSYSADSRTTHFFELMLRQ